MTQYSDLALFVNHPSLDFMGIARLSQELVIIFSSTAAVVYTTDTVK